MDDLEVIFSYLPPEQAVVFITIIVIATLLKNFIEKHLGYVFNPRTKLQDQLEEMQKGIQSTADHTIKKYLI